MVTQEDFTRAKDALDKAQVPPEGRIARIHKSLYENGPHSKEELLEMLEAAGFTLVVQDD